MSKISLKKPAVAGRRLRVRAWARSPVQCSASARHQVRPIAKAVARRQMPTTVKSRQQARESLLSSVWLSRRRQRWQPGPAQSRQKQGAGARLPLVARGLLLVGVGGSITRKPAGALGLAAPG